jgi:hypothetical protein
MRHVTGFFWFTIMTTIGYGNYAPVTNAGRTMVLTLGFASLLMFGAVLARAGQIISAIVDDLFVRFHCNFLTTRPWATCFAWGALYYLWMLAIAAKTVVWKEGRLGESFGLRDGYWFAYISTTTIGLGDMFLEPEVLFRRDVFIGTLLLLMGFTFLSSFLVKLTEVFLSWKRRKGFYESMLDRLETTHLPTAAETTARFPDQVNERSSEVLH